MPTADTQMPLIAEPAASAGTLATSTPAELPARGVTRCARAGLAARPACAMAPAPGPNAKWCRRC
eukprot:9491506-Pyramimonas_sp.AAC.1